jgi:MFS family permease
MKITNCELRNTFPIFNWQPMTRTNSTFLDSFTPFQNVNFRTYLLGQGISLVGTFMQQMALQWFIWEVTQDTRWIGIVAAVTFAPAFFLMPLTGAIADRVDRRKLLIITQVIEMSLATLTSTSPGPISGNGAAPHSA